MINNRPPRVVSHRGITLLELTIVVLILLSLISILFIGASAWKRGGDRAACVLTLRNVQMAARCYQNLYGYGYGDRPYAEYGSQDIAKHLYQKGYIEKKLYEQATGVERCPAGGSYTCPVPDIFPQTGVLYMKCSLSASNEHKPVTHTDW